jgi:myo-inositol 2-dehydrogenase / D-chiro-inositol 1-dehydrogenase
MAIGVGPVSVGIIGTGGMGARHARNLHDKVKGATVAGLSDVDEQRVAAVAVACGGAPVFADPYQLIADERIDAVLISSPDATHVDYVLACLEQNKPVLCEKPLAITPEEAQRVIDAEIAAGRRLVATGFMRRFDPAHAAVNEARQSGALGRPVLFRGVHRNAGASPGLPRHLIVTGSAVHDIDSARWLLQEEIVEVFARGFRVDPSLDEQFHDLLLVQLTLSGNCLGTIEVFVSARYGYEVVAEVVGSRGTAVTAQAGEAVLRQDQGCTTAVHGDWLERFQDAYVLEAEQWIRSLRGGHFKGATAWDGYMSLVVAQACINSVESGRPEAVIAPAKPAIYQEEA